MCNGGTCDGQACSGCPGGCTVVNELPNYAGGESIVYVDRIVTHLSSPPPPSPYPPPPPSSSRPPPPPSPSPPPDACGYMSYGDCDDGGPGADYNVGLIVGAAGGGAAGLLLLVGGGYLIARRKRKVAAADRGQDSVKSSQTGSPPPPNPPTSGHPSHVGGMQTTDPATLPTSASSATLPTTNDRVSERVGRARASVVASVERLPSDNFSV